MLADLLVDAVLASEDGEEVANGGPDSRIVS